MSSGRVALLLALAVIYAACYSAIKVGLSYAPPLRFAGMRAAVAGGVLIALVTAYRGDVVPSRRLWPSIVLVAAAGTSLSFGAMFLSLGRSGAGIASVLGNTGPLFAVLLAAVLLGEPVTRGKVGALALGLAGVTMIASPTMTGPATGGPLGAAIPLLAALAAASESVLVKRMQIGADLLRVVAWQLVIGSAALLLLSACLEWNRPIAWTRTFVLLVLFLAVIGTALSTSLWYWLLQGHEVGRLTVYLFLVPVLGMTLAAMLFGERLGTLEVGGMVLTVLGLAWVLREGTR